MVAEKTKTEGANLKCAAVLTLNFYLHLYVLFSIQEVEVLPTLVEGEFLVLVGDDLALFLLWLIGLGAVLATA